MATIGTVEGVLRLRDEFTSVLSNATRSLEQAGQSMQRVGRQMSDVGMVMTARVTLPLVAVGAAAVKLAVDAEESANKFNVVMGGAADRVRERFAELHKTIPLTTDQMETLAAGVQDLLVPMGLARDSAADMSADMVELAGDLASFNNVAAEVPLEAIKSALAGMSRPLRQFGVDVSEGRLQALGLSEGLLKAGQEMDKTTRAQLIFMAVQKDSADAMGDAARTVDSTANMIRFLWRDVKELTQAIGEELIPVVRPWIATMGEWVSRLSDMDPAKKRLIVQVGLLAAAIGPLLLISGKLLVGFGSLIAALPRLAAGFKAAAVGAKAFYVSLGPIGLALIAITAALVAAGEALRRFSRNAQRDIEGMVKSANRAGDAFRRMRAAQRGQLEMTAREMDQLRQDIAGAAGQIRAHQEELLGLTRDNAIAVEHLRGAEGKRARDLQSLIAAEKDRLKQLRITLENARAATEQTEDLSDATEDLDAALRDALVALDRGSVVVDGMTVSLGDMADAAEEAAEKLAKIGIVTAGEAEGLDVVATSLQRIKTIPIVAAAEQAEEALEGAAKHSESVHQRWVKILDTASMVMSTIDKGMARALTHAANLVQMYEQMKDQWDKMSRASKAMASAQVGQQIFGLGQAAGVWSGDRGTGRFGGGMGGDYADTGAMVGAIIGGLTPLGPVGAIVGGAIGGLIGGLIKRGADRAVGELTLESGELAIAATRVDEKMQGIFRDFMGGVAATLNEIMDMIGGEIANMDRLQVRIQKDLIHVYVNGMKTTFDEVEDAVNFAAAELLRTADITGISDVMRQILSNTFEGAEQLKQALQFGEWYERLGLDQVEIGILDGMRELRRAVNAAMELGLDVQPIIDHFVGSMGAMRDQILGIADDESIEEKIRREAQLFEAMRLMQIAELEIRKADLEAKAAQIEASRDLLMQDMLIGRERLNLRAEMLDIEGEQVKVQAGHAQAMAHVTSGSLRMLEAVNAALEVLRSLEITQSDIEAAIARAMRNMRNAGQGANKAATDMERLAGILEQMEFEASLAGMSDYEASLARLAREFEAHAELAHGNADLLAALNDQLDAQARILRQDEFARIADVFREIMGTGRFTSDPFIQLALRFNDAIDQVAQGLEDGVVSAAQAEEWIARLNAELERQAEILAQGSFVQLGDSLLSFIDKYYGDAFAGEELRMRLEQVRFTMELANMQLQFESLKATGLLAEETIKMLEDGIGFILANPVDWEAFFADAAGEAAKAVVGGAAGGAIGAGIDEQVRLVHDRMVALKAAFVSGEITLAEYQERLVKLNKQMSLASTGQLIAIEQLIASLWPLEAQVAQIEESMMLLEKAMNAGLITALQYAEGLAILQGQLDDLLDQVDAHPLQSALDSLLSSLFPMEAQIAQIEEQMELLAEALAAGLIDADRYADAIALLNDRLSDIKTREVRREIDALIAELDALANESMRVVSELQREIGSLERFLDSLKFQHGTPAQTLATLEQQILAAAQAGDIAQFQALSQQFLQMAGGMFGTAGAGFLSRLTMIQGLGEGLLEEANDLLQTELEHLAEINEAQASILEANMDLLDLTQEQIDEIRARGLAQEAGLHALKQGQEARHQEAQDKMTKLEQAIDRLGDILAG